MATVESITRPGIRLATVKGELGRTLHIDPAETMFVITDPDGRTLLARPRQFQNFETPEAALIEDGTARRFGAICGSLVDIELGARISTEDALEWGHADAEAEP